MLRATLSGNIPFYNFMNCANTLKKNQLFWLKKEKERNGIPSFHSSHFYIPPSLFPSLATYFPLKLLFFKLIKEERSGEKAVLFTQPSFYLQKKEGCGSWGSEKVQWEGIRWRVVRFWCNWARGTVCPFNVISLESYRKKGCPDHPEMYIIVHKSGFWWSQEDFQTISCVLQ